MDMVRPDEVEKFAKKVNLQLSLLGDPEYEESCNVDFLNLWISCLPERFKKPGSIPDPSLLTPIELEAAYSRYLIISAAVRGFQSTAASRSDLLSNYCRIRQDYPKSVKSLSVKQNWAVRWVAIPVAYLFPKADREEWLGDLREMHYDLIVEERYPRWFVNVITVGRTMILVWSAIEVRLLDLISHISGA